ncbi:MAG: GNAT family N-acetyltransferase [Pseudomonadota bacterium]
MNIRHVTKDDLPALYDIALKTGDAGQDATHLHKDPKLIGHIYAAPYAIFEPESGFVVEDDEGVAGYIVGTCNTLAFDDLLENEWWPLLRKNYADPSDIPFNEWNADQLRAFLIHYPFKVPQRIVDTYPSHLHINLLPRLQGKGVGVQLIDRWLQQMDMAGSRGVHLGVAPTNERALYFYRNYGFKEQPMGKNAQTIWFTMVL